MKKIVGVGACVLDTVISCRTYPKEDSKYRADSAFRTGGGPVANALAAASRLGAEAEYLGALPADADGRFLRDDFVRCGVRCDRVRAVRGVRAFTSYIVLAADTGSRTCVFERGTVPDDPRHVDLAAVAGADALHLDGNALRSALAAAAFAKAHGVLVSLDAGGLYEGIEELLPYADVLIPSEEFALRFTGAPDAGTAVKILYEKYRPAALAVTQGARGGLFCDGGRPGRWDGFAVDCVDSNGAGDVFHGAFLSRWLEGRPIGECCRFAAAAASIKCTAAGVRNALPDAAEVTDFLKNRGGN